jgi:hypothetical protein
MTRNDTPDRQLPVAVAAAPANAAPTRAETTRAETPRPETTSATFLAQALGAGGARRGLRGGAPVLRGARHAYLAAEWSGGDDRRAPPGALRRTAA